MALVLRAAVVTRPIPPPKPTTKSQHRLSPPLLSPTPPQALSLLALFSTTTSSCCEAKAFTLPKEKLVSSLNQVEDTIDRVEDVGSQVLDFSLSVIRALVDALKPGVDAGLPFLRSAGEEAIKIASPVVSDASRQAKEALESAGVDPSPVLSAAKTVADVAQQTTKVIQGAIPLASEAVKTISSSDPTAVVVTGGALFVAYILVPPLWSAVSFNLRGYKGNLSPAQTLDLISTQNHIMVDIRSEKDKTKAGVPRLPSGAKNKIISVPLEELPSKIKNLVRNVKKVEAEIVALKISYLKRINKGSNIVIMDSYSDTAKIVARALTNLGFKNCWVMTDGFSGGKGWLQSRLGTDSYNVSFVEVVSPSRIIPAVAGRFGTTSSRAVQSTGKLLPGSIDN